eukprot:TRINITY_DN1109_c0_g1_i1.p1 TRINITY_DN1109_c0_g1~~TRINITY_DN1109_c0_g1_i1.p1  ORF type:complete len:781 (-),score=187.29 TRINITY_DN1109_c0_g1_i1:62-2404(-)
MTSRTLIASLALVAAFLLSQTLVSASFHIPIDGSRAAQSVYYNAALKQFVLHGRDSSYVFRVDRDGNLEHLHWGARVDETDDLSFLASDSIPTSFDPGNKNAKLFEFSDFGTGDFRSPSVLIEYADGSRVSPLIYKSHTITAGKPIVDAAQPAVYVESSAEATTLKVTMVDSLSLLEVDVYFVVYHSFDIISRRMVVRNTSKAKVSLLSVQSTTVDFPTRKDFTLTTLTGAWSRERFLTTRSIDIGFTNTESRRGASSHQNNPFGVLSVGSYSEDFGEHYGFSLIYSGNFLLEIERVQTGRVRVNMGINPFNFRWSLDVSASFASPECVLVYSNKGISNMSRQLHRLYATRLSRGRWRDLPRPILVNSWEAMYFDVSESKIVNNLAVPATEMGIELIVLDDGWFGQRDNDTCCLGDWYVNTKKLPNGIGGLASEINRLGLKFGIWMEPEMISENSDLYRAHPDWALQVPGRPKTESRNQLVLDMSRQEIRDFIVDSVTNVLSSGNVEYLKWDFNRHLTEVMSAALPADRQGELFHRFVLGVYDVMERLTRAFPNVLFESCSGGGGRFDPAMLYYMPQAWTSDNTDAVSRVKIQYGTSLAYPAIMMGAHVSAIPNHQTGRETSMRSRTLVAYGGGSFGYELDLSKMTSAERAEVLHFTNLHSLIEPIVRSGDFYRLHSPFQASDDGRQFAAWMFVSPDQTEAVFFAFNTDMFQTVWNLPRVKLQGLRPDLKYFIDAPLYRASPYSGQTLMSSGLPITFSVDAQAVMYVIGTDASRVMDAAQ